MTIDQVTKQMDQAELLATHLEETLTAIEAALPSWEDQQHQSRIISGIMQSANVDSANGIWYFVPYGLSRFAYLDDIKYELTCAKNGQRGRRRLRI